MNTLLKVMDENFKHVTFNENLAKEMFKYRLDYLNSRKEHMEFFSSNLLGTLSIRFTDAYVLRLFDDILYVDLYSCMDGIKRVDAVNTDFKISSDVFNLVTMYMIYRFTTAEKLNAKYKTLGTRETATIFYYRTLSALTNSKFKYKSDPRIVTAAYARMSNKHLIKKLGTWNKVIDYRVDSLLGAKGIHAKTLQTYSPDEKVLYLVTDAQGRIKESFKGYYGAIVDTKDDGVSISTTSNTIQDLDGHMALVDKVNGVDKYGTYLKSILEDKNNFIKKDLIELIVNINKNSNVNITTDALNYISENSNEDEILTFVDDTITYGFYLLNGKLNKYKLRDYENVLSGLKSILMSSRSTDDSLLKLRADSDKILHACLGKKIKDGLLTSTRTTVMLYLIFRSILGQTN